MSDPTPAELADLDLAGETPAADEPAQAAGSVPADTPEAPDGQ